MKKPLLALLFAFGAAGTSMIAACDSNDGPAEEAGEEIDEAADDVEDAVD
ncbi:hypothetical protein WNY37_07915 [Henriciella sp. AS95]